MSENNHKYKEGDSLYLVKRFYSDNRFYNDNKTEFKPIPVKVTKMEVGFSLDGFGEVHIGEVHYCVSALTSNCNEKLWVEESELYPSL